jgi:hypothetical protein
MPRCPLWVAHILEQQNKDAYGPVCAQLFMVILQGSVLHVCFQLDTGGLPFAIYKPVNEF